MMPITAELLSQLHLRPIRQQLHRGPGPEALTPGQLRIVERIAAGYSAKETAAVLHLSICTVRAHQYSAFERLGIKRQAELIHWAIRHGVVAAGAGSGGAQ